MKSLPSGLQAHLDDGTTTLAWCWRIERADGAMFGFTDHDRVLDIAGMNYEPDTGFAASEIRASADFSVDGQDAETAAANVSSQKAKRQRKGEVKPPLSDDEKAAFYARMVNADVYLPQSVISNTIRHAMLVRGLVTPERLRQRGVR